MSLMRLLAAGRSLVGAHDNPSRYRMRTANLLPKFGSSKNPFAQPAKAHPPAAATPAKLQTGSLFEAKPSKPAEPISKIPAPESRRAALPRSRVDPKPVAVNSSPAAPSSVARAPRPRPVRSTGWIKAFNPFSWLPARPRKSARALPVQTEMALEKVKVVRNDLNDADLEVVPGRFVSAVEPAPAIAPAVAPAVNRTQPTVWGRLASLYLDIEQTHS